MNSVVSCWSDVVIICSSSDIMFLKMLDLPCETGVETTYFSGLVKHHSFGMCLTYSFENLASRQIFLSPRCYLVTLVKGGKN